MSGKFDISDYVPVNERIEAFKADWPEGSLQSSIVELTASRVTVKAYAYRTPDDQRPGIGHSSLEIPGATPYTRGSEIENAETSAWGRAIAALGFEVKRGIASHEEVRNKQPGRGNGSTGGASPSTRPAPAQYRRDDLIAAMRKHGLDVDATERLATEIGIPFDERPMKPESIDKLIAAIESPEPSAPAGEGDARASSPSEQPAAGGPPSPPAPSPSMDEILAVTGGEEIPPEPGTDAYKALTAPQKAAARAWHAMNPKVAA